MKAYKDYLEKQQYSITTIESYILQAEKFTEWVAKQGLKINLFRYKEAIQYVNYLQKTHTNPKTINHKLTATKHYFNYLINSNEITTNPFTALKVQGEKKNRLLHNLLSSDELEDLYYSYETETDKHPRRILANKRNKVIIGLLVYQGLTTSDLKRLELEHLELYKGKIYIPRGNIGNRRTLELKPWQVLEFIEYIGEVRPKLLPTNNQDLQLVFIASQNRLTDTVANIIKKLKKINHKIINIHQIRASVIVNWLNQYNLRKVQILAGHKYISTTERYVQEDLRQLQEIVNLYHPLS
ncbi:tyrosine-type recombinase/integrase [Tenacibaculum halocynthiae]|uniref:tyrosine-type recombinase/integrase n=1 Tax=Tenacibaculum halocynthiae TaxID=1254437 RepID=UPI0038938368